MFTDFTIFGSSLSLLQPGEQGVVNRVESADEATIRELKAMGIVPGVTIILQRRCRKRYAFRPCWASPHCANANASRPSPAYKVIVGGDRLILNQKSADAIYVRLTARSNFAPIQAAGMTRLLTALLKRLRKNNRRIEFAATQSKSACAD